MTFSFFAWLYTDLFATVSSVFALTALAGALPTLKGFMSSDHQKQYAGWLDRLLFQGDIQRAVYLAAIGGMLFFGFVVFHPVSIKSESASSATVLAATFSRTGAETTTIRQITTVPGQSVRIGLRRPIFGGPDRLTLTANDLPQLARDLSGIWWARVAYPIAFWEEPVILMRPGPSALVTLRTELPKLTLTRKTENGEEETCIISERYLGEPLWLGTGGRALSIQASTVSRWREQAALDVLRTGAAFALPPGVDALEDLVLAAPISSSDCLDTLTTNDQISWSFAIGSSVLGEGTFVVSGREPFPIEFPFEVKN